MPSCGGVVKLNALRHDAQLSCRDALMRSQALRADLLMLITAMIWGSAFVAQRLGMDSIGPFLYTGLRFALACLVLLPLLALLQRRSRRPAAPLSAIRSRPSGATAPVAPASSPPRGAAYRRAVPVRAG